MPKKTIVISLGGSLIIPDKVNVRVLREFRKVILKNSKKYRFVVVCGGGKTARNYIKGLDDEDIGKRIFFQCLIGISATRMNARFMNYFFNINPEEGIPHEIKIVEEQLKKKDIVFCGGLRYEKAETSDSVAAKLARHFNSKFINLTNVHGLYDKNPKTYKNARFIPEISHKEFYKIAKKIKYKPGQHFVLDQKSAKIIKKYNITTYILGPDMKNLDNLLNNRHFVGTVISRKTNL